MTAGGVQLLPPAALLLSFIAKSISGRSERKAMMPQRWMDGSGTTAIILIDALSSKMHQLQHNSTTLNSTIMTSSSSSDKDSNDLTDPRFLVITSIFFLYGVFIILVLFFSRGTSFWSSLWRCLKDLVGRRFGVASDAEGGGERDDAYSSNEGTYYQLLSERSKLRLDALRQLAIERLLVNYSLKLRKENVVMQQPKIMTLDMGNTETTNNDGPVRISSGGDSTSSNTVSTGSDIEEGFCSSRSSSSNCMSDEGQGDDDDDAKVVKECDNLGGKDENVDEASYTYTHVVIPYPGVGLLDGLCIETSPDELTSDVDSNISNDNKGSSGESVKRKWPFTCKHFARRKEDGVDNDNNNTDLAIQPDNETSMNKTHKQSRRQVPIFCSICLSEFDLHQQISWSSNTACTHVFHSDCMIQWLVALGRKHSAMKRFTLNPTERQLLGHYELQCPCCRQEFIKSAFIERKVCEGGRGSSSAV